jgi:hypothetical protein
MKVFQHSADEVFAQKMTENHLMLGFTPVEKNGTIGLLLLPTHLYLTQASLAERLGVSRKTNINTRAACGLSS